jgi:hypothetical protein
VLPWSRSGAFTSVAWYWHWKRKWEWEWEYFKERAIYRIITWLIIAASVVTASEITGTMIIRPMIPVKRSAVICMIISSAVPILIRPVIDVAVTNRVIPAGAADVRSIVITGLR